MIKIGKRKFSEIIVKNKDNTLVAMVTDKGEIVEKDGIKVDFVLCESY